jgi:poly(3-hydroxybutyrate) depolymerase
VHGSFRVAETYRDLLWQFAEESGCVLLCPLFPCGVDGPSDTESYKFVYWPAIRYDSILLAMVEEVAGRLSVDAGRFVLFGYSGGGQFAHRFFYGHPGRLLGVSIGAPGSVTLIDPARPWQVGTGGLEAIVGPLDPSAMRRMPVQMVVGDADVDPTDVISKPGSPHFRDGINDSGGNRVERLDALAGNFRAHGIDVELATVPGVAHDGFAVLEPVKAFVHRVLSEGGRA